MDIITRSSWKICPPKIIRYPNPAPDTRYSPIIVPTHASPTLTFNTEIIFVREPGRMSLYSIWNLLAPMDFSRRILFLSHAKKPLRKPIIATIMHIKKVMTIIGLVPIPTQMMIRGPRAIFGRLLRTTIYGSSTFRKVSEHHNIIAATSPAVADIKNPYILSSRVILICIQRFSVFMSCLIILEGLLTKKESRIRK